MKKIKLETVCPNCGQALTEGDWINLKCKCPDGKEGTISLSTFFGDYSVKLPFFIEDGMVVVFLCPHCGRELTSERKCSLCNAPLFMLKIKTGGVIEACSRKGCKGHAMGGFGDPDELLMLLNQIFDTPYL